jgi:hypothetical protein
MGVAAGGTTRTHRPVLGCVFTSRAYDSSPCAEHGNQHGSGNIPCAYHGAPELIDSGTRVPSEQHYNTSTCRMLTQFASYKSQLPVVKNIPRVSANTVGAHMLVWRDRHHEQEHTRLIMHPIDIVHKAETTLEPHGRATKWCKDVASKGRARLWQSDNGVPAAGLYCPFLQRTARAVCRMKGSGEYQLRVPWTPSHQSSDFHLP